MRSVILVSVRRRALHHMIALVTSQGAFPGRHAINGNCLEPQGFGVAPRLGCHTNEPGPAGRASCALRVLRLFCGSRDDGGGHVRGPLAGRGPGTSPAQRTWGRRQGTLACPPWGASPRPPRPPPSWPAPPLLTCRCVGSQLKRGEIHSCRSSPDCSRMPICTHINCRVWVGKQPKPVSGPHRTGVAIAREYQHDIWADFSNWERQGASGSLSSL